MGQGGVDDLLNGLRGDVAATQASDEAKNRWPVRPVYVVEGRFHFLGKDAAVAKGDIAIYDGHFGNASQSLVYGYGREGAEEAYLEQSYLYPLLP